MFTFTSKSALILLAGIFLFCSPAFGQVTKTEDQKLTPIDLESGDGFGRSVALDGDTAVIGAAGEDDGGTIDNGAAYVFTRSGGVWTEQAKLLASDKDGGDRFGCSVALDGDTVVIGAFGADDNGTGDIGAAYVFTRSDGVWTEQAKLMASDKAEADGFGWSVALDGGTAVIGAYTEDDGGTIDNGAAYVFTRSGGVWTEQAKLLASDKDGGDFFGWSVALDGDTAVVGAIGDDAGWNIQTGAAYVFTRSGGVWTEQAKLLASEQRYAHLFGNSVALDGDTAVVGAPWGDDTGGTKSYGDAFVFTRSGGVWTEQAKLQVSDKVVGDNFGHSVALDGDTALIGALYKADGLYEDGAAYVFTRSASVWTEHSKLLESGKVNYERFGHSVALDGDTAVIGANGENDYSGAAYVFAPIGITSVNIDIRPGSLKNPINLRAKKGTIPVAILTTNTFDALQVDWETVRFGPSGATERHERLHVRDADYDGDMDVVLHFETRNTGILCGDTEASLTGKTFSGEEFTGSDVIKIVKCPKNKNNEKKKRR
jgi:hypothetical protein